MKRTNRFHSFTSGLLCLVMLLTTTLTVMPLTALEVTGRRRKIIE